MRFARGPAYRGTALPTLGRRTSCKGGTRCKHASGCDISRKHATPGRAWWLSRHSRRCHRCCLVVSLVQKPQTVLSGWRGPGETGPPRGIDALPLGIGVLPKRIVLLCSLREECRDERSGLNQDQVLGRVKFSAEGKGPRCFHAPRRDAPRLMTQLWTMREDVEESMRRHLTQKQ